MPVRNELPNTVGWNSRHSPVKLRQFEGCKIGFYEYLVCESEEIDILLERGRKMTWWIRRSYPQLAVMYRAISKQFIKVN